MRLVLQVAHDEPVDAFDSVVILVGVYLGAIWRLRRNCRIWPIQGRPLQEFNVRITRLRSRNRIMRPQGFLREPRLKVHLRPWIGGDDLIWQRLKSRQLRQYYNMLSGPTCKFEKFLEFAC